MKTNWDGKGSSELAKAIAEIGRVAKTMYLLNYIDDAGYRNRNLIKLNHSKQRHQLARGAFHGRSTGRYDFTLTAQPKAGGLRPLRQA